MANNYLKHYGVKGMKWGVRRTPEQLGHHAITKKKTYSKDMDTISYSIKDKNGSTISKMNVYDFKIKDFDWALLADLDTALEHRGKVWQQISLTKHIKMWRKI